MEENMLRCALEWARRYWDGVHETWDPPIKDFDGDIAGVSPERTEADIRAERESLEAHLGGIPGEWDPWEDPDVEEALDAGYEREYRRWRRAHGLDEEEE